ncbi:MAG: hypothetical protein ACHQ1G_10545 [Planctomycetota bacterium]
MKRALLPAVLLVAACASDEPHRVTDLESGRVYYTKDMRRGLTSGKIRLIDARTGAEVTVGSSKVERVPEEEFAREVSAK